MTKHFINLAATRAYAGIGLDRLWRSPVFFLPAMLLLGPQAYWIVQGGSPRLLFIGIAIIAFGVHVIVQFNQEVLFNDERPERVGRNLARRLSSDMVRALVRAKQMSLTGLVEAALSTRRGRFILQELDVSADTLVARAKDVGQKSLTVLDVLEKAELVREEFGEPRIDANSILYLLFQSDGPFAQLLNDLDLSTEDLRSIMRWERFHDRWHKEADAWKPERLLDAMGSVGRSWVMGYTSELDAITIDVNRQIGRGDSLGVIHKKTIENVTHVLSRSQQDNVLILGKPGVGKRTLVYNLARQLRHYEREKSLPYTRMLLLQSELLVSSRNPDALLLQALASARKSGRFILVVDNLGVLLKAGSPTLLAVLTKCLQAPNVSLIALADVQEYHTLMKNDPGLDSQFEKLHLDDASDEETMLVLMAHFFTLDERAHMHVSYKALRSILELSKRFIGTGGFPGKAVGVLSDTVLAASRRGVTLISEADVREMVSLKAHMNVRAITADERTKLLNLEGSLTQQIVGQEEALRSLVGTLKRARLDIHAGNRPLGTFLFLGPTGVGKTQTAKVLAREYFGAEDRMIRLDMNEFSSADSMRLIVGAPDAGGDLAEGFLARRVQDRPFSLILLDEIEKAHPNVLNTFLQILDEGFLIDSRGVKTDFRNTIIIATSNAGALFMRDVLRKKEAIDPRTFKQELIDAIIQGRTFSPEFINRFDDVILYMPLSQQSAKKVAIMLLDRVIADLRRKKGITLMLEAGVVDAIVERGYSQDFGAREMRRTVTDVVENYVADHLLQHEVKRGETITIRRSDLAF